MTPPLRDRQIDVLVLAAQGLSNTQIAVRMGVSLSTVKTHIRRLLDVMAARDRTHALALAVADGLVATSRDEDGSLSVTPLVRDLGLVPCPSPAAYQRHVRRNEPVCDGCREVAKAKLAALSKRSKRGVAE